MRIEQDVREGGVIVALSGELLLMPTAAAPGIARRFVRELFGSWRQASKPVASTEPTPTPELVDRMTLVTSELVTNAVVHARTPIRLRVELHGGRLRLNVDDRSPRPARPAEPAAGPDAEAGRGLQLVGQLARAWGVRPRPGGLGKTVWCVFSL